MVRWKIISHPHTQNLCYTKYSIIQRLSNKQSVKVICRFDRLRIAQCKRQTRHMSVENLLDAYTFDYICNAQGKTSFEGLATALDNIYSG